MYIQNVTKDHDLRQNELAMGKYLENIFSGRQTREMESITLPVSNTEQSITTTWDGMPYDFLHRPMGICTKTAFVSADVCARNIMVRQLIFLFHIGCIVGSSSGNDY